MLNCNISILNKHCVSNLLLFIQVCHVASDLLFEVKDKDHMMSDFIGYVPFPAKALLTGRRIENQWFPIMGKSGKGDKGRLQLSIQFISVEMLERTYEVPCYFPMHRNCRATLYFDAHVPPDLPR